MHPENTIYAVCIRGEKVRYQAQSRIVPIMGGAYQLSLEERSQLRGKGFVFDDEGAELSSLNAMWGELTCIHWMLLNAKEANIGNAQYRRNWLEPNDFWYDDDTLYVPEAACFSCSLEQQFYGGHSSFDAPSITRAFADTGQWALSREEIDAVWKQNMFFGCNMARGSRQLYMQFMTTLFNALIPIWEKHKKDFMKIKGYDKRALAFIAERLITAFILHREKLFPGVKILTAPIGFIN